MFCFVVVVVVFFFFFFFFNKNKLNDKIIEKFTQAK